MKTTPVTEVWIDQFLEKAWNTTENPDSLRSFRPVFQQLYARMPAEWQETEKGKLIESYAFPAPTVEEGDDMADGLLYDAEGESHHLSELQGDTSCWISGVSTAAPAACLNRKWKRLPIYMAINWPW